jgi:3-oxoadipate enol-lactonase
MPTAQLGNIRLHYRLNGPAAAPVLVLSNGLGLDLHMWDAQIPALGARFRVLRYDTRGHGRSAIPDGPSTIDRLGRDVLTLLEQLGIDRVHFCGLSLGGMTGMWLGANAAERLSSLVLANTAPHIGTREMWDTRIDTVNAKGMKAISDAAIARWFTPEFIARAPAVVASLKAMFERTLPAGYVSCCSASRDADLRETVAAIRVPTLIITGRHDVATPPAQGVWLANRIPGAHCAELAAAHLSNLEAPDAFTALVADHIASTSASRVAA